MTEWLERSDCGFELRGLLTGWKVHVREHAASCGLQITLYGPALSVHTGAPTRLQTSRTISRELWDKYPEECVQELVKTFMMHEAHEALWRNGKIVHDPHERENCK